MIPWIYLLELIPVKERCDRTCGNICGQVGDDFGVGAASMGLDTF